MATERLTAWLGGEERSVLRPGSTERAGESEGPRRTSGSRRRSQGRGCVSRGRAGGVLLMSGTVMACAFIAVGG
jgi:hypothetical protein